MTAKKGVENLGALRKGVKRKVEETGKHSNLIDDGRESTGCIRLTRATAKERAGRFDSSISSPDVKHTKDVADAERVPKVGHVKLGRQATKNAKNGMEKCGQLLEKPQTRAFTRSEKVVAECDQLINGMDSDEIPEIQLPRSEDWNWTEDQEKALQEAYSTIKPTADFWHLIAKRVPGKSAEHCFIKFYSEHRATRAARRLCPDLIASPLSGQNDIKSIRFPRSKSTMSTDMIVEQEGAIRQAVRGTVKEIAQQNKVTSNGCNIAASTRQTRATSRGIKPSIGGASSSASGKHIKSEKAEGAQNVKLGRQPRKGIEDNIGKCGPSRNRQTRAGMLSELLAAGSDLSPSSEGNEAIESASAFAPPIDDELVWTKVQEEALHDAFSTIKPTADFWHHISKRVPGRNAEECFNKFYSGHPTPPRAPQRLCFREMDSPASRSNPPKAKAAVGKKRLLQAHRTVRKILRKQQVEDEEYEADAFAALEHPDVVQSVREEATDDEDTMLNETEIKFSAAVCRPGTTDYRVFDSSDGLYSLSEKENWKPTTVGNSRMFRDAQSKLGTPEVLKRVKDPVMLDKYIDLLHQRHTKGRRATCGQKNSKNTNKERRYQDSKPSLDVLDATVDVIHRAKQELRNVFSRSGSAGGNSFGLVESNSSDEEFDDASVDSQMPM